MSFLNRADALEASASKRGDVMLQVLPNWRVPVSKCKPATQGDADDKRIPVNLKLDAGADSSDRKLALVDMLEGVDWMHVMRR